MRRAIARDQNQRKRAVGSQVSSWVNGFNPQMFPDLQLWLDAADISTITESGGAVSQWDDKSGNGYHVVQGTGAAQPTTGLVTQNGLNTIDFDGNDNLRRATATALGQNVTGLTVYSIVKYDSLTSETIIQATIGTNTTATRFIVASGATGDVFVVGGRTLDANSFVSVSSSIKSTGVWYNQIGVFDYANTDLFQYVNGTLDGSTTSFQTATTTSNTASQNLVIGNIGAGGQPLDGSIAEIIIYHSAHNPLQRATVLGYLNRKWGL